MRPNRALTLGDCQRLDVDGENANNTDPFEHSASILITSNVGIHIEIGDGAVATSASTFVPANSQTAFVLSIGVGQRVSALGVAPGAAFVTTVR